MKSRMETRLSWILSQKSHRLIYWGTFFFTVFMIAREGMETALMLIQVPEGRIFGGVALGVLAVGVFCFLWVRFSSLINLKLFFQVTGVFLLLFVLQVLIYSFHEFCEAGVLPNSEVWHVATEPFSPDGIYGRWFSVVAVAVSAGWLLFAWAKEKLNDR